MKVLFTDYTFNAAAKTITFNTSTSVGLNNVLLITNVTDNIIIYNFANPNLGGTISNNVLTLTYNTTSMSNIDSLQIFIDIGGGAATEETLEKLTESVQLLNRIAQLLTPIATQDSSQRQRIAVEAMPASVTVAQATAANLNSTVSQATAANLNATVAIAASQTLGTVTTVSSVTNIAGLGGVDPRFQFIDLARTAYNTGPRNNLSFS
jgi:hypothetical protein